MSLSASSAGTAAFPVGETWRSTPAPPPPPSFDIPRYRRTDRSMFVAYLLWFLFGNLGLHRMYLGRVGSGFAIAGLTIVGWILAVVYFVGFFILVPVGLFILIDAFRIPGWVRGN